jgi:hypothetical protein
MFWTASVIALVVRSRVLAYWYADFLYGNLYWLTITQAHDPILVAAILNQLRLIRLAGAPLSVFLIRGLILGHIRHRCPELLEARLKCDGSLFKCSESFVRKFIHEHLNWTPRAATRAAQKLPHDALLQCYRTFMRMVHIVMTCGIRHPGLRINFDQTQVVVQDTRARTYAERGSKQVDVAGKEEKRAWTCVTGISDNGDTLPFQVICEGATTEVHPPPSSPGMDKAKMLGIGWDHNRKNYWSNQETMQHYFTDFIVPYFVRKKLELGYGTDQICIVYLDAWSVHRSQELRLWVRKTHPWLYLVYVPGNLTGLFQPCDVGIQRFFKHAVRRAQLADTVKETVNYLDEGGDPFKFKLDTRICTLRKRSVMWFVDGFEAINDPDLVLCAWRQCNVGDFDLSFESVTSLAAAQAYTGLRQSDAELYDQLQASPELEVDGDDAGCPFEDQDAHIDDGADDSALEHSDLLALHMAGSDLADTGAALAGVEVAAEELDLEPTAFDFAKPDTASYGRGKRQKIPNVLYKDCELY